MTTLPDTAPSRSIRRTLVILVSLLLASLMPYVQTLNFEFINLDDDQYVSTNNMVLKGLTWEGLVWSLSANFVGNWQPLTGLSHMLDCDLYRQPDGSQWAGGHHLSNVVLHSANTGLVFFVLLMMTGAAWRSAFVAALFGVHPTHVESVAWISERKDVLSTLFGLLAIMIYVTYTRRPSPVRYGGVMACFALSLCAKPMWVTLPFILLLLDLWPLQRWGILTGDRSTLSSTTTEAACRRVPARWAILEKLPIFALSIVASIVALFAQQFSGAIQPIESLTIGDRMINAVVAYASYLQNLILPTNLALLYPYDGDANRSRLLSSAIVLAVITTVVVVQRHTRPWLLIGWLLFLGMLVPVIGLVQVGGQSMADRYLYVPALGIFIMVIWSIPESRSVTVQVITSTFLAIILAAFTYAAHVQTRYWKNSKTVFARSSAVTHNNYITLALLGAEIEREGNTDLALTYFNRAIELGPRFVLGRELLARTLIRLGRPLEAVEHLLAVMESEPTAYSANQLGNIFQNHRRLIEAHDAYQKFVELDPTNEGRSRESLANVLIQMGRIEEAKRQLNDALAINPNSPHALRGMGVVLIAQQQLEQAAASLSRSLELEPTDVDARSNLGWTFLELGRFEEAIHTLMLVKQSHPERYGVRTNLAKALAGAGRRNEAMAELQAILADTPQFAPALLLHAELNSSPSSP